MDLNINITENYMLEREVYEKTGNNKIDSFYSELTSAAEKSQSHAVGNALSLTMIPYDTTTSYGMMAFNSDKSTSEDPIIKISCNYGGDQRYYDVHVNEVDPRNASAIEMFALCAYMDENEATDAGAFGSYNKLHVMGLNASMLGDFVNLSDSSNFNVKTDWIKMLKEMAITYLNIPETFDQSLLANKLVNDLLAFVA